MCIQTRSVSRLTYTLNVEFVDAHEICCCQHACWLHPQQHDSAESSSSSLRQTAHRAALQHDAWNKHTQSIRTTTQLHHKHPGFYLPAFSHQEPARLTTEESEAAPGVLSGPFQCCGIDCARLSDGFLSLFFFFFFFCFLKPGWYPSPLSSTHCCRLHWENRRKVAPKQSRVNLSHSVSLSLWRY